MLKICRIKVKKVNKVTGRMMLNHYNQVNVSSQKSVKPILKLRSYKLTKFTAKP